MTFRGSSDTGEGSTTSRAVVEGIEVSTEHWIGGRRVPSNSTFTDVSPIDGIFVGQRSQKTFNSVDVSPLDATVGADG